jgi:hypothetical protein
MFVKDSKTVVLMKKVHQHDAEEKNKIKFPALWTRSSERGQLDQIYVDKS